VEKVANVVRFSRKVAKSVKRWPMLFDFAKGGQAYKVALYDHEKGGQVSKKVASVLLSSQKGGQA